jgi:hypothetical protein
LKIISGIPYYLGFTGRETFLGKGTFGGIQGSFGGIQKTIGGD